MSIVTLLNHLVEELSKAEQKYFEDPEDFFTLETTVKTTTDAFAASYLGLILSDINAKIEDDIWRKGKYTIQRHDTKTLITSVGDVVFDNTYFRNREDGTHHYLTEEAIGLDKNERFSEAAEVALLVEASKTSYEEATKVIPSKSKITKTTVMNKVHGLAEEMPLGYPDEKTQCEYLFIEADEDHVAEQHGRWYDKLLNKSFISKLIYVYEYKLQIPETKGRKVLMNTYYVGGVYEGSDGNAKIWENINTYIETYYDTEYLKKIYISGDGAPWIKAGVNYLDKAVFVADKFHIMQYINRAAGQMLDEKDIAKSEIYRMLHKKERKNFTTYTNEMMACAKNTEPIEKLQTFVLGNWKSVMLTFHDKTVDGCSAESHVSHMLSDRLSSRPKGWSIVGADRMSKLRCYEKNYGRDGIIYLVQYSRQQKLRRTGTDNQVVKNVKLREIRAEHYNQSRSYIDRMQVSLPQEIRKIFSIRERLNLF